VDYVLCERRTKEEMKSRVVEIPDLPEGAIILDVIEKDRAYPLVKVLLPVEEEDGE